VSFLLFDGDVSGEEGHDEQSSDEGHYADEAYDEPHAEQSAPRGRPGGYGKSRKAKGRSRTAQGGPGRKKRRARWVILLVAVALIMAGAGFGALQVLGFGYYPDYSGSGTTDVVFQINSGDTIRDVGNNLQQAGIVESANAFVKAARDNDQVGNAQPGYYVLKEQMSGAAAVAKLVAPASRVGQVGINSGMMLNDTTGVSGKVTPGVLSKIAAATCAKLNGRSTCLTVADFQNVIQNTSPAALGVPSWAIPSVTQADAKHRLEGLLMPGVYNIRPGATAAQDLSQMLSQSAAQLQAAGLPSTAQQRSGFSPYQILIIASIVERESGVAADMPKIARVLYNRLVQTPNYLDLDSTVDYGLDRPMVRTSPTDRAASGAYNSYNDPGLPPTPISSPNMAAIQGALEPANGPWLFFVVCQKSGASCFANTYSEHLQNIQLAQQNGAY
jgi:peptidoglycan lytic transglycosylase G